MSHETTPDGLPVDPMKRRAAVAAQFDDLTAQLAALPRPTPSPLPRGFARQMIYGLRAKDKGEAFAHCITRREFARCVVADPRTRQLFTRWRHESRLDLVVTEWTATLDTAAALAGLPHRSAFLDNAAACSRVAAPVRAFLAECEKVYWIRLNRSREARVVEVERFVCTGLYSDPPPIRAWLCVDILKHFEVDMVNDISGGTVQTDTIAPVLAALPKGQRPKDDGEHLERNARWHYEHDVQVPAASWKALAADYQKSRTSEDAVLTKDRDGRMDRFDDSLVRRGAANAKRLLELTVPPQDWNRFEKLFRRRSARR